MPTVSLIKVDRTAPFIAQGDGHQATRTHWLHTIQTGETTLDPQADIVATTIGFAVTGIHIGVTGVAGVQATRARLRLTTVLHILRIILQPALTTGRVVINLAHHVDVDVLARVGIHQIPILIGKIVVASAERWLHHVVVQWISQRNTGRLTVPGHARTVVCRHGIRRSLGRTDVGNFHQIRIADHIIQAQILYRRITVVADPDAPDHIIIIVAVYRVTLGGLALTRIVVPAPLGDIQVGRAIIQGFITIKGAFVIGVGFPAPPSGKAPLTIPLQRIGGRAIVLHLKVDQARTDVLRSEFQPLRVRGTMYRDTHPQGVGPSDATTVLTVVAGVIVQRGKVGDSDNISGLGDRAATGESTTIKTVRHFRHPATAAVPQLQPGGAEIELDLDVFHIRVTGAVPAIHKGVAHLRGHVAIAAQFAVVQVIVPDKVKKLRRSLPGITLRPELT